MLVLETLPFVIVAMFSGLIATHNVLLSEPV